MALADYAPHRFTVEEYLHMGTTGLLSPDARVELIEGQVIDMPPIGPPHASTVKRISKTLERLVGDRSIVSTQDPVVMSDISMPQPDVAVLHPRDDFYDSAHPGPDDIVLVTEVGDTTLQSDRKVKLPLYARCGVREAWLVDVASSTISVCSDPADGEYRSERVLRRGDNVTVLGVEIPVGDLLGPERPSVDREAGAD